MVVDTIVPRVFCLDKSITVSASERQLEGSEAYLKVLGGHSVLVAPQFFLLHEAVERKTKNRKLPTQTHGETDAGLGTDALFCAEVLRGKK